MNLRKLLLTLLLSVGLLSGLTVPAGADAAAEEFWNYAYQVDKDVVVNPSDGLGLYMRHGAGTEYPKVCQQTIPMKTTLHITHETTDSRGWKWGMTEYTFPDGTYNGWVCLVETYPAGSPPAENPAPVQTPEETPETTPQEAPETPAAPVVEEVPAQQTDQGGTVYTSLMLMGIGIVIGVVVVTALLLLLRKRDR